MRAFAFVLAAALAAACGHGGEAEAPHEAHVPGLETVPARVASVHDVVHAFGAVTADATAPDARDAHTQLADAEAKHRLAVQNVRRLEELARGAVAPRKELEAARADEASTAAAVERARLVLASFGSAGSQTPLAPDEVWMIAQLVQQQIAMVAAHAGADVVADAFPGRTFAAEVDATPTYVDPTSHTAPVRLRVKDPEHLLRPGMTGAVTVEVGEARDAVLVPEAAVVRDGADAVVFVEEDGKYVPRHVRLRAVRDGEVEVVAGIAADAHVVTTGAASLLSSTRLPASGDED